MAQSVFRQRGIPVVLDTTEVAELDAALYGIGNDVMERIGRNLLKVTHSPRDRPVGEARVRELEGFDVIFMIVSDAMSIRIVIAGLRPPDPEDPTEEYLRKIGLVAKLRGAFGV